MKSAARAIAILTSIALLLTVLAACNPSNQSSSSSTTTLTVATNVGKFDIATIGSYETPIWAHNGWL